MSAYDKIIDALLALDKVQEEDITQQEKELVSDMEECLRFMRKQYFNKVEINTL